ncbi:MAG: HAD-IB family phosphatase [Candidatus Levyibacteriota bacterium]
MKKTKQTYFLLDFDSTFITGEGLEIFAEVVLENKKDKKEILNKIISLTDQAMEGKISFGESLQKRIALLSGNKSQVRQVGKLLKQKISPSILQNKNFFLQHKDHIYIISGGFKEFIYPAIKQFGIRSDHIFANTFVYDQNDTITGVDTTNLMSQDKGKVNVVKSLKLKGDLYMIGDGYTDYELKKLGLAKKFIAFTENISREPVIKHADEIASTFDEFLYVNNLPRSLSYPKNRITVLALQHLSEEAKKAFAREHYQIKESKEKLSDEALVHEMKQASILYVESLDQLSENLLTQAQKLLAVGIMQMTPSEKLPLFFSQKGIAVFYDGLVTKRIINFINTGDTYKNLTLPSINLPKHKKTHRLLHMHKNESGILAQINSVMAKNKINIISQYLQTTTEIGYVITDVDKEYDNSVLKKLKQIPHTIRFRVLY